MLSVEAIERRVGKKSALLKAGGDVMAGVVVFEPDEDRRRSVSCMSARNSKVTAHEEAVETRTIV
jgi:hypothetical protein